MDALMNWAAMGGYATWVWGSYGVVAIVLIGLTLASLSSLRKREAEIAKSETRRRPGERSNER